MSNKIFRSIWLAAVCVLLAALAVILGFSYRYFSAQQKRQSNRPKKRQKPPVKTSRVRKASSNWPVLP